MNEHTTNAGSIPLPTRREPAGGRLLAEAFVSVARTPALCESQRRVLLACEDGSSAEWTVRLLESDPALAIAVIYGAATANRTRVASLRAAVERLGPTGVMTVVAAVPTYDPLNGHWAACIRYERFRRHAASTRAATELVAALAGIEDVDGLLTAALLHDAGRLVLAELYGTALDSIEDGELPEERLRRERLTFGTDHALVGAVAAGRWGLPATVASAVERHHAVDATGHPGAIRLGDLIAHHASGDPLAEASLSGAARQLGLGPDDVRSVLFEFPLGDSRRENAPRPCPLSARELDALHGLSEGKVYKQIAGELSLSVSTVRTHLHNVYRKTGAVDRAQAVLIARDAGWL